ncbi:hypothetical protein [Paenibacillus tianjinensis]|uniref:Uncharacterized protein n=1 Tax=Paenibacillus tianjinensis TaxID=2810347 RepID=A0ABX7L4P3_9BACL|nr:hypothetical protein [Paenibacillus tianjinensis]QSF42652.1 hypothetical protein JRJ22_15145 [Paenibacillus tianjinensis]
MALKMNISRTVQGEVVTFENCYVKITNSVIEATTPTKTQKISVTAYDETQIIVIDRDMVMFEPDLSDNSDNNLKQGYEHLKILDKYIQAVDC